MQIARREYGRSGVFVAAGALVVLLAVGGAARASTVVPMTMTEMADLSGQVIVGEVTLVRSYWADNPRRIESEIMLGNVEYLKGRMADSSSTFKLIVPGGTVGEWGMRIADAPILAAGERWVLFILPTYKTFPVVGLSQGGFRVLAGADGVERVHSAAMEPVKGLGGDGFVQVAARLGGDVREHLVAEHNVRVKTPVKAASAREEAMSLSDFKALIQPIVNASKAYQLKEPAGRRVFEAPPRGLRLQKFGVSAASNNAAGNVEDKNKGAIRGTGEAGKAPSAPRQPTAEKKEGRR